MTPSSPQRVGNKHLDSISALSLFADNTRSIYTETGTVLAADAFRNAGGSPAYRQLV